MYTLPIFPLHTVLFPNTPLHLHIFEERYKLMIGQCMMERRPFGVTLIRRGLEALGPLAEPYRVGCSAHIVHVQRLDQGRMNIVALGRDRFRIRTLDAESHPYLLGEVEDYPLEYASPQKMDGEGRRLRQLVERFIQLLVETGEAQFDLQQLPVEPVTLAYLAAALLQSSPSEKQELLELERAADLLVDLQTIYRRETALLDVLLAGGSQEGGLPFSKN
jgi:Lon protease-like protein